MKLELATITSFVSMLALGCVADDASTPSENDEMTSGTDGTVNTSGTPADDDAPNTSGMDDPSDDGEQTDDGNTTEPEPDATEGEDDSTGEGPTDGSCDVWEQDCPEGEKCAAYANEKSDWWNDLHCVPVPENPAQIGDPCYAPEGPAAGIDDCDHGGICWDVDEEGMGICLEMCTGSAESPSCSVGGDVCVIANGEVLTLCLAGCDPLLQDCGDGQGCYPAAADGYVCAPDDSARSGGYGDPCEYVNVCDPGLFCADASNVPGCVGAMGCCSEYCDLSEDDPDAACSGEGQICVPHFDPVAPGFEDAGGCVLP